MKRDCGEASLTMTVAMIRDLKPLCHTAAQTADGATKFVVCAANVTAGPSAGSRLDLGTALIMSGFAFASIGPNGKAVHEPYLVAQLLAQKKRSGLWAFADTPDPNQIIMQALRRRPTAPAPAPPAPR